METRGGKSLALAGPRMGTQYHAYREFGDTPVYVDASEFAPPEDRIGGKFKGELERSESHRIRCGNSWEGMWLREWNIRSLNEASHPRMQHILKTWSPREAGNIHVVFLVTEICSLAAFSLNPLSHPIHEGICVASTIFHCFWGNQTPARSDIGQFHTWRSLSIVRKLGKRRAKCSYVANHRVRSYVFGDQGVEYHEKMSIA